jgi:hypothetical protein
MVDTLLWTGAMFLVSLVCPSTIPCVARHDVGTNTTVVTVQCHTQEKVLGVQDDVASQYCMEEGSR